MNRYVIKKTKHPIDLLKSDLYHIPGKFKLKQGVTISHKWEWHTLETTNAIRSAKKLTIIYPCWDCHLVQLQRKILWRAIKN